MVNLEGRENNMEEKKDYAVPEVEGSNGNWFYVCSECHTPINWKDLECPICRKEINWDE